MKVGSVDNAELRGQAGPRLTADIDRTDRAVTFHYASEAQAERITFESSEELSHEGDAALVLGFLPAMRLGIPLRVSGHVSPLLLEGVRRTQPILRHWDESLQGVSIEAEPRPLQQSGENRVGAFFSGGVDSFYTALRHQGEITDLIFIRGFDLPLSAPQRLQRQVVETAREVAEELGTNLIELKTNIRDFSNQYANWGYFNGICLAAIALLFQGRFGTVHLPASMSLSGLYDEMTPHPLIDPLLSTECTQFVSSGVETDRIDKIAYLANSDLAMSRLRVCWEIPGGAYNCGACGKCLRTMISLHLAGGLGKCRTLPDRLDLTALRRMPVEGHAEVLFTQENLRELEARNADRQLRRAVRSALRRREGGLRAKTRGFFRGARR
jgi:hypothetical protein